MKVGIIGAGAMGSLLGFYLSAAAEVWLLDSWQAQVDAINATGLRRELDGIAELRHPRAASDPAAIGACDVVLVLVKAHQTRWAAEQAQLLLKPDVGQADQVISGHAADRPVAPAGTLVVTLQNGVGNQDVLAAVLGSARVGQGVTALGATLLAPGRVRHAGQGPTVFARAPDPAGMAALAALFNACNLPADLTDDLDALVWNKVLVNAGINALTALLRVPNRALATVPQARALLEQVVAEAAAVAQAHGVAVQPDEAQARALAVAEATGANRSSMLQDVLRGSPSEIATINGAVVREGQRLGIPTPVNALLTALVAALDATAELRVGET
jgi:2-dehydropantoate 2-reductase